MVEFKVTKLSQLGRFLFYCSPFKERYFSSVDLEMGVHVRVREMSTYRRLKCRVLEEKLPRPQFGVCLWEVSTLKEV